MLDTATARFTQAELRAIRAYQAIPQGMGRTTLLHLICTHSQVQGGLLALRDAIHRACGKDLRAAQQSAASAFLLLPSTQRKRLATLMLEDEGEFFKRRSAHA